MLIVLLGMGYTPTFAGAAAIIGLIIIAGFVHLYNTLHDGQGFAAELRIYARQVWDGFVDGGPSVVIIAALLATASMLVTVLSATGLGVKFSLLLLAFSGEHLLGVLLIAAMLCILLGMDVPTTASYLLTAPVIAPVLSKLGLEPLTAHLYIFYFAILSAITPPVSASVYAAATIAGENFWKVAGQALRIAGAVFLLPFMMVYRPEMMLHGSPFMVAYTITIAWVMVVAISGASIGYLMGPVSWPMRLFLYVGAEALFYPSLWADALGVVMVGGFLLLRKLRPAPAAVIG